MALDFSVDLDALDALQRSLAAVREDLTAGPAGRSAREQSLNPRVDLAASTVRANSELSAPFAYGLLHEAPPLGRAHEELARTVHALVGDLQELIDALRADAAVTAGRYRDADASVFGAVTWAGGELDDVADGGGIAAGGGIASLSSSADGGLAAAAGGSGPTGGIPLPAAGAPHASAPCTPAASPRPTGTESFTAANSSASDRPASSSKAR